MGEKEYTKFYDMLDFDQLTHNYRFDIQLYVRGPRDGHIVLSHTKNQTKETIVYEISAFSFCVWMN